jgi:glyoxylase-like metal-dependent hydrolase (beta-lactamase superfamily II)
MAIAKPPRQIRPNLYRFAPNRETLGGTAYLLVTQDGNILIDCPPWDDTVQQWLNALGPVRWLCLTHRDAHSPSLSALQQALDCLVVVQEQEAYLLPHLKVRSFQAQGSIGHSLKALWTPGYSPGSACYYWSDNGGVLFTGRHLLPNPEGVLGPLRYPKTFHWPRQEASVQKVWDYFADKPLRAVCPGGNVGYLRNKDWLELPPATECLPNR